MHIDQHRLNDTQELRFNQDVIDQFQPAHGSLLLFAGHFYERREKQFDLPVGGDLTGHNIPNPYLTAILRYQHKWNSSGDALLGLRADSHFETESFLLYDHHKRRRQPASTNRGASLNYTASSDRWDAALWARNLENKATYGAGATVGPIGAVYLGDPRTCGLRIGVHF